MNKRWYDIDPTVSLAVSLMRNANIITQYKCAELIVNKSKESGIDLIQDFVEKYDENAIEIAEVSKEELDKIISDEGLNKEETYNFIQRSFEQGRVETNGTEVSNILPPMNMFTPTNDRQEKKNKVIDKLLEFFDKFFSISSNKM